MFAQRQSNIKANLQHRMDVATAKQDHQLLQLLTHEQTQLESTWHGSLLPAHRGPKVTQLWQHIAKRWPHRSQLSVEQRTTTTGEQWWHVEDPRSGKTFHAESLSVALHWIEENRLGH